jgi:hypothetical protein
MKFQTTNESSLKALASDQAWAIVENITNSGLSIDEAVDAQVQSLMQDAFDEYEFDAPFNPEQMRPIMRAEAVKTMTNSPTSLWNYAQEHPAAYVGDDGEARIIEVDGAQYKIIVRGDNEDDTFAD